MTNLVNSLAAALAQIPSAGLLPIGLLIAVGCIALAALMQPARRAAGIGPRSRGVQADSRAYAQAIVGGQLGMMMVVLSFSPRVAAWLLLAQAAGGVLNGIAGLFGLSVHLVDRAASSRRSSRTVEV